MRPVYYHFFCPCSLFFFVVGTYIRSLLLKISMIRSTRTFKGPLLHPYTKPNTINIDKSSLTKPPHQESDLSTAIYAVNKQYWPSLLIRGHNANLWLKLFYLFTKVNKDFFPAKMNKIDFFVK